MTKNKDTFDLGDIGGFFGALFGACVADDRKAKKDNLRDKKGGNNVLQNIRNAMIPDEKEVKHLTRDFRQLKEARRFTEGGLGEKISDVSQYATGQKPPGIFIEVVDMITGKTPKYAFPLDENKRAETISDLKKYGEKQGSEFSDTANKIAENLEQKDAFGIYKHQSLASAANEAEMPQERIEDLVGILKRETQAREQAQKEAQAREQAQQEAMDYVKKSNSFDSRHMRRQSEPERGIGVGHGPVRSPVRSGGRSGGGRVGSDAGSFVGRPESSSGGASRGGGGRAL